MGVLLVVMFIVFVAIGVPISFALGVVSFTGIASLGQIPNLVVFQKMFNGLNSFTLLAVPLFILAANLMNEGEITEKLIDCCNSLVGHLRGGLAYSNVLVSMIFLVSPVLPRLIPLVLVRSSFLQWRSRDMTREHLLVLPQHLPH